MLIVSRIFCVHQPLLRHRPCQLLPARDPVGHPPLMVFPTAGFSSAIRDSFLFKSYLDFRLQEFVLLRDVLFFFRNLLSLAELCSLCFHVCCPQARTFGVCKTNELCIHVVQFFLGGILCRRRMLYLARARINWLCGWFSRLFFVGVRWHLSLRIRRSCCRCRWLQLGISNSLPPS